MPDSSALLLSRVDTLLREIGRVESSLDTLEVQFDRDLRERVVGRFQRELGGYRTQLGRVRGGIETNAAPAGRWNELASLEASLPQLFGEALGFLEGALARQHGLDNGLCAIADSLLDELSRRSGVTWDRFTILADGEYYAAMSSMIRLRFSETSIWNLPILAHEFAHYVAPRLETDGKRQIENISKRERRQGGPRESYLQETFADVFATYTLGPAYALCCLLRFSPANAHVDGPAHPASVKRFAAILATLEHMNASEQAVFAQVHGEIANAWRATLAEAAPPQDQLAGELGIPSSDVAAWTAELCAVLDDALNPPARFGYGRWLSAQQIAAGLKDRRRLHREELPRLDEAATLAEVINAAWYARWTDWAGAAAYGPAAYDLCGVIRRQRGVT